MKIAIITHKEIAFPNIPFHFPLLVGAYKKRNNLGDYPADIAFDDSGENISKLNHIYNELTGHYWMWKNVKNEDYYGLCHYRRYFNFSKPNNKYARIGKSFLNSTKNINNSWTKESLKKIIEKYDVIVAKKEPDASSAYTTLKDKFEKKEAKMLEMWIETTKEISPEYLPYLEKYISQKDKHMFNMFIMKKEFFEEYSKWLFDILFLYEKKCRKVYGEENLNRRCGFLGEHLLNVYLLYKRTSSDFKIGSLQTIMFYNTDKSPSIKSRLKAYGNSFFTKVFPYGSSIRDYIKYNFIMR